MERKACDRKEEVMLDVGSQLYRWEEALESCFDFMCIVMVLLGW